MRNLKYAILGLVNREPMTGYDIKKAFEDRALTSFWHAEHSQIYPELKRLVDEGMVSFDTDIRGE
ncbi:MAG: PadR family transcriptional regulator, partial [Clostridia bacterium]|nr:PadR family transcriptional regulator [Clostridia bacterium]